MSKPTHEVSRHLIQSFEAKALRKRSLAVRFADDLTSLFGSMVFLTLNAILFVGWILINTGRFPAIAPFDPYPFSMLTTAVSLEAIILTVIVLMSQNRQSLISSLREEMGIQVDLIAEREITKVLQLMSTYLKNKGIKIDDPELESMLKGVDASYIERRLESQLTSKSPSVMHEVAKPIVKVGEEVEKVATGPIIKVTKKVEKTISSQEK
jgi:uncharacterized membrane protein